MSVDRYLLLGGIAAVAAVVVHGAGPALAIAVLMLAGWLREHALRRGVEARLRAAVAEVEAAAEVRVVRIHADQMREILWESSDSDVAADRVLH